MQAGSSPPAPFVTYTYRGDGLRSTKTVTTTPTITYTWDINVGLPEVLQDGSQTYVYGLNGLISQTDGSGNQTYFLHDGLDSIRELTNGSGTGVADYYYDAFGADRGSTWSQRSTTTEYTFNGQQDDPTLGLYYLRARYYDPYTGRFLSKDPFPGTLANPASQHYYGYAYNNPVNLTDPSGRCPWCAVALVPVAPEAAGAALTFLAVGTATISAGLATLARWDDISAFVGSCLEQQGELLEQSATIFYASDKSIRKGINNKAAEWQKDKDNIQREPGAQARGHWENTKRGHEESIARDLERLGPKARKEAKEFLGERYPEILEAMEE